jgi:hypothetical protein|tara:strand:+ start:1905 stop:2111 length:207 start_codon:yes stop_codon:yes gene_type:complete
MKARIRLTEKQLSEVTRKTVKELKKNWESHHGGEGEPAKTRSNYTQAVNGEDSEINVNPFGRNVHESI